MKYKIIILIIFSQFYTNSYSTNFYFIKGDLGFPFTLDDTTYVNIDNPNEFVYTYYKNSISFCGQHGLESFATQTLKYSKLKELKNENTEVIFIIYPSKTQFKSIYTKIYGKVKHRSENIEFEADFNENIKEEKMKNVLVINNNFRLFATSYKVLETKPNAFSEQKITKATVTNYELINNKWVKTKNIPEIRSSESKKTMETYHKNSLKTSKK